MLMLCCALLTSASVDTSVAQLQDLPKLNTIGRLDTAFKTFSSHEQPKTKYWVIQNLDLTESGLAAHSFTESPPTRDSNLRPSKQLRPLLLKPIFSDSNGEGSHDVRLASFEQDSLTQPDVTQDTSNFKPSKDNQKPDTLATLIGNDQSLKVLTKQIKDQIELVTNDTSDEVEKEEKLQQLNKANEWIQKANTYQDLIVSQNLLLDRFETDLAELKSELASKMDPILPDAKMNSETLQLRLQDLKKDLQEWKTLQAANQAKMDERDQRVTQLPTDRTVVEDRLNKLKTAIANVEKQPSGSAKDLSTLILKSQEWAAKKELGALDVETPRLDQTGKLLPVKRNWINLNIQKLEAEITSFRNAGALRREKDIASQQAEAQRLFEAAINADPVMKQWAEANQRLTKQRKEWTAGINQSEANEKIANLKFEEIKTTLDGLKRETEKTITAETGINLAELRHQLLQPGESQERILKIQTKLQDIRILALKWKEERKKLASPDQAIAKLLSTASLELPNANSPTQGQALTAQELTIPQKAQMAQTLVTGRIEILDSLDSDFELFRKALLSEEKASRSLVNKINETHDFIDKKALWVVSARRLSLSDFADSTKAVGSFFKPAGWIALAITIQERTIKRPYETGLGGLILVGLFAVSRRLKVSYD